MNLLVRALFLSDPQFHDKNLKETIFILLDG